MHCLLLVAAVMPCRRVLLSLCDVVKCSTWGGLCFPEADEDRSGTVSWDEFINIAGVEHCASLTSSSLSAKHSRLPC